MTHPPPTMVECKEWVSQHCQTLLQDTPPLDDVSMVFDSVSILVRALDAPTSVTAALQGRLSGLKPQLEQQQHTKDTVSGILAVCEDCGAWIDRPTLVRCDPERFRFEQPRILPHLPQYTSMTPDKIDVDATWFRRYFVGKPYLTLIGPISDGDNENGFGYVVISVIRENEKEFSGHGQVSFAGTQYRIIVRSKEPTNKRYVISETVVKQTMNKLEAAGQGQQLEQREPKSRKGRRPLRSFSSALMSQNASQMTRPMRAAVLSIYPDVDLQTFKELSAEATILSGLEKEFLRFDEIGIPKWYKFGVLDVRVGQTTEEEWFANSGLSSDLEHLLGLISHPVELKGYKGYAAGLDIKSGESGNISYASSWQDHDIMFHVASLMPSRVHDRQQVHRKRYIGNDIVCLVFMEDGQGKFDPKAIRSQFLHVYIVVYRDTSSLWRVEVVCNKSVPDFGPWVPSPALFKDEDLGRFLILKLINAENAALQSDRFIVPNTKARQSLLQHLVETGLETNVIRASTSTRLAGNGLATLNERPKSAGSQRTSRGSMRSLRAALESPPRPMTPDFSPTPLVSRSNVLRELKHLGRRRSATHTENNKPCLQVQSGHSSSTSSSTSSNGSDKGPSDEHSFSGRMQQARHRLAHLKTGAPLRQAMSVPATPTSFTPSTPSLPTIRSRAQHFMSVIGRRTIATSSPTSTSPSTTVNNASTSNTPVARTDTTTYYRP